MLWNLIRDFFVQHFFGGYDSNLDYYGVTIGWFEDDVYNGGDYHTSLFDKTISFSDYLSTMATIITMVLLLVICCKIIKGIYNSVAHAIN